MSQEGKYLVIEGVDGAGKTTQHLRVTEELGKTCNVVPIIEPGQTPLGAALRALILHTDYMKLPETEFDLFTADRRELTHQIIRPAVSAGKVVLSDRNWFSSVAYQSFGGEVERSYIIESSKRAMGEFFMPDGVVILDAPIEVTEARMFGGGNKGDWFEKKGRAFFERVRRGYHWIAEEYAIEVIDASPSSDEVFTSVYSSLGKQALS